MRPSVQYTCLLSGGAALLAGLVVLLVLAQHSTGMLALGAAFVVAGLGLFLAAPAGRRRKPLVGLGLAALLTTAGWAVVRFGGPDGPEPTAKQTPAGQFGTALTSAEALERGIAMLRASVEGMNAVDDYTYTFTKRQRAKGLLGKVRLIDGVLKAKVRREPFSVYVRYVSPEAKKGTEAIFVEGRNDGKLIAHSTRPPLSLLGTLRLEPTDWRAMIDQRYPITRLGITAIAEECLRVAEADADDLARCEVRLLENQIVAGRPCHGFEIENPDPEGGYELALIRVVFDDEWKVPVYTERWSYLESDGVRKRLLVEQYTVTDVVFGPGLTDEDFDPDNPAYGY